MSVEQCGQILIFQRVSTGGVAGGAAAWRMKCRCCFECVRIVNREKEAMGGRKGRLGKTEAARGKEEEGMVILKSAGTLGGVF